MPIKEFQERRSLPVIGKIRLGIRKVSQGGKEYPSETDYFVLTDAPDVEAVYGKEPKQLEAMFPSDDLNLVMPHFYKWYSGGVKAKNGDIIGGKLNCYGDGDVAHHLAKRDPVSRVVPTRTCAAEKCPDWIGSNGIQQCKAAMSVFVILPRVSLLGMYQIDTTSKTSIQNFVNQMYSLKDTWGTFRKSHFILYRDPTPIRHIDAKSGEEKSSVHNILRVRPDESFTKMHGAELQHRVTALLSGTIELPKEQLLIESPMEDNYAMEALPAPPPPSVDAALVAANDPSLSQMFDAICALRKVKNTEKVRLLTARKFEKETDIKSALKAYLTSELEKGAPAAPANKPPDPVPVTPPPPPVTQPALTADGLI